VVWHRHIFGLSTVWVLVLLRNALNTTIAADTALVEFAVTVGAAALGALIGAAMAPVMVGRMGTRAWSTTVLLTGAPFAAIGFWWTVLNPSATTAMAGLLLSGAALGWIGQSVKVCGDTVIQAAIDDDHRGRVFAIYDMAVNAGLLSGISLGAFLLPADGLAHWPVPYIFAMFLIAPLLLRFPPRK
jgi:MFS family permease